MSLDKWDAPTGAYTSNIPAGTAALRKVIREHFSYSRTEVIRDPSRCAQTRSEHCECAGIDAFTTDPVKGRILFDWLVKNADALGVQSVIFLHREIGFGNPVERHRTKADHMDHVHVGLNRLARANLTEQQVRALLPGQEDWLMALTDAEQKELLEGIRYLRKQLMDKNATGQIVDLPDAHTWEGVQEVRDKVRKGFTEGFPAKP